MIKRKIVIYMCSIFAIIEVFLLLEQQFLITSRDAEINIHRVFLQTSNFSTRGLEEYFSYNNNNTIKVEKVILSTTENHDNGKTTSTTQYLTRGIHFSQRPLDTSVILDKFLKQMKIAKYRKPKNILTKIKKAMSVTKKPEVNFKKGQFLPIMRTKRRLDIISSYCNENIVEGKVERVLMNPSNTVSYCVSHKVASTNWLRVFRFLWNNSKSGHHSSPSKISKMEAHFSHNSRMKDHSFSDEKDVRLIGNTSRFMFVREPYVRLWSVFIDKFILADNYFWSYHGPRMARINGIQVLSARKPCYYFSFLQFINYVIKSSEDYSTMDDHIKPLSKLCNPCVFKPNFVGKVETMATDFQEVLEVLGVNWGENESTTTDRIYDEMKTIIDFNFYIVEQLHLLTACLNLVSLGERILRAFVLNGYIPESAELVLRENIPQNKEALLDSVWKIYKASNRTHTMVKEQRNKFRREAYQTIPLESLLKLQNIYHDDFYLFDYRLDPPEIFYNKSGS